MILVRNPFTNMLGGGTGKVTFERIKDALGIPATEFRSVYNILVQCAGAHFKVIGIRFMTLFIRRRDAACF